MVRGKHFLCAAAVTLLLAIIPTSSLQAQQPTPATNPPAAIQAKTQTQPPAQAGEKPNSVPENQQAAPAPSDKNPSEHLPFMAESERESQQAAPSTAGLLLRTLGALLLIVGLIVAAAWGMKRFGGARFGAPKEDAPDLAILNSVALGDRRSVAIVQFGRRTLLLGSTPQAITLLAESESENIAPRIQSVADILNEEPSAPFVEELNTAADRLAESEWKAGEGVQW